MNTNLKIKLWTATSNDDEMIRERRDHASKAKQSLSLSLSFSVERDKTEEKRKKKANQADQKLTMVRFKLLRGFDDPTVEIGSKDSHERNLDR